MASDVRTTLRDYNRDLLTEELVASALPFELANLYGFVKLTPYIGTPAPGPRVISWDKVADVKDEAQPGEIRFEFTTALTVQEGLDLDALLTAHDESVHTAAQDRQIQDEADLSTLTTNHPGIGTMDDTQLRSYVSLLARVVIRGERGNTPI